MVRPSPVASMILLAANQHRFATMLWLVELLDRREERIHIDVQDVAGLTHEHFPVKISIDCRAQLVGMVLPIHCGSRVD